MSCPFSLNKKEIVNRCIKTVWLSLLGLVFLLATGTNVYSIGTYGSWDWQDEGASSMRSHSDAWVNWFDTRAFVTPTEYFIYLIDESSDYPQTEQWAQWINDNPGPGDEADHGSGGE